MTDTKHRKWNSDKALSLLAIFLSLGTLMVFLYQTNLIKKQQYASVLPYLEMGKEGTGTPNFKFAVENKGVGPAIIEAVEISHEGKAFEGSHVAYVQQLHAEINDSIRGLYLYSALNPGMFIPSGGRVELIEVLNSSYASNELARLFSNDKIGIKITYKSIYDEVWSHTYGHLSPVKLK